MRQTRKVAYGFTLVELLVVIGIIAVLIAILLPVLSSARKQANTTQCLANMRSIGQVMFLYAAENKGSLPYSYYRDGSVAAVPLDVGEADADAQDRATYVWWSVLRGYTRRGGTTDNSTLNADGSRSTRFMKMFSCPVGQSPDAGCDFASNPVAMPELNWESAPLQRTGARNPILKPATLRGLYPDNILLWDATELGQVDPPFSRQYVTGYDVDNGSLMNPKQSFKRFRDTEGLLASDASLSDNNYIFPGPNRDIITSASGLAGQIRWRHGRNDSANFLLADGSAKTMGITKGNPATFNAKGEVLRKFLRIKWPGGFSRTG